MRGSHPLPDQLPGEHTGPQSTSGTDPLFPTAFSAAIHTHSHMLTVDRSMVVGHIPMGPHMFFYVHQSYRYDSTHPAFLRVGEHSVIWMSIMQAEDSWLAFFFPKLFNRNFFQTFPMVRFEPGTFHSASEHLNHLAIPVMVWPNGQIFLVRLLLTNCCNSIQSSQQHFPNV